MRIPKEMLEKIARQPELAYKVLMEGVPDHLQEHLPRLLAKGRDVTSLVLMARYDPGAVDPFEYEIIDRRLPGPREILQAMAVLAGRPFPASTIPMIYRAHRMSCVTFEPLPSSLGATSKTSGDPTVN